MATANEFIDALGGTTKVAIMAGVGPSAVSNWRKYGMIPPRLYLRIAAHARERGVDTPEELFRERIEESVG